MKQFWLSGSLGENKNADNNDSNCGGDADNYLQVIEVKIITEKSQRVVCETPGNYDQGVVLSPRPCSSSPPFSLSQNASHP